MIDKDSMFFKEEIPQCIQVYAYVTFKCTRVYFHIAMLDEVNYKSKLLPLSQE